MTRVARTLAGMAQLAAWRAHTHDTHTYKHDDPPHTHTHSGTIRTHLTILRYALVSGLQGPLFCVPLCRYVCVTVCVCVCVCSYLLRLR